MLPKPVTERCCRLRCKLVRQFFLALLDLMLLPIFVPVVLLAYRARPVVDALRSGGADDCEARLVGYCDPAVRVMVGWKVLLKQAGLMLLDLMCLPLTLLILVTAVRVRPVLSAVRQCTVAVESPGDAAESEAAESSATEPTPINLHLVAAYTIVPSTPQPR